MQTALIDALGVDEEEVTPQATMVGDLGAESIDFLDIVFKLEKSFGIEIPRKELSPEDILTNADYVQEGKVTPARKKKTPQLDLFKVLEQADESGTTFGETKVERHGETVLDRIHQSMILFAAGRSEALKRFVVEDGAGRDQRFWRLAQALSALYPSHTEEKRWVDGVLARKKGLGF